VRRETGKAWLSHVVKGQSEGSHWEFLLFSDFLHLKHEINHVNKICNLTGTLNHNVMSYCKHGRPFYEAELWVICLMLF